WKGRLARALELHKAVVGLVVRLPLHLFDSFLFGYFRRALSYGFRHGTEDFFAVQQQERLDKARRDGTFTQDMLKRPPLAERWLESSLQAQYAGGTTGWQRFMARPETRGAMRWLVRPLAAPLARFVSRRVLLAVFSAGAMGVVAGAVPMAVLGVHLASLPVLGAGLGWLAHGLPALAAHAPLIGGGLSSLLAKVMGTLVGDLTVAGVLDTLVLSTALTYPAAVRQRLMDDRGEGRLTTARLRERAFWYGLLGTFFSLRFWLDNMKSFFGLITVGAEIEGVMGYAGGLDAAISPSFHAVTGHDFKLFETIGAAVERPQGQSPVPFGGAITWGNVLLYKLQNLAGFNLTDQAYQFTHGLMYGGLDDSLSQTVIGA
ncbi:MAG: hypothetical protein KGL53_12880, partial [Elusimicrobia bacterium]|nr:hypothetical protein [Elusimicrobiota bacterium]